MGFSWAEMKQDVIKIKIRRAKTMAKAGNNDDFKNAHPDWVQEAAQTGKYIQLTSDIKKSVERRQALAMTRRAKRAGTN